MADSTSGVEIDHQSVSSENAEGISTENLIEDGKNSKLIVCQRCPSKILRPRLGNYQEIEFNLPYMTKKPNVGDTSDGELLKQFWAVDDIYKFENMGFSNTVGDTKYLVCADCEIGPLGWHNLQTKVSYVALQRVVHQ